MNRRELLPMLALIGSSLWAAPEQYTKLCAGCHGTDGKGTGMGSDLTSGKWLWGNGSLQAITRTIVHGVPKPKNHTGAMPPMGGAPLSQADLAAVADYVWAIGHQKPH